MLWSWTRPTLTITATHRLPRYQELLYPIFPRFERCLHSPTLLPSIWKSRGTQPTSPQFNFLMLEKSWTARRRNKTKHDKRNDYLFILLRWPLLVCFFIIFPPSSKSVMNHQFFIFLFIMAEFGFYVVIRQLVNTKEWISACIFILSPWFISG